jgi:group I intron endonuclease
MEEGKNMYIFVKPFYMGFKVDDLIILTTKNYCFSDNGIPARIKDEIENLKMEIIEEIFDVKNLIKREQYWMDTLKPVYNNAKKAGNCLGVKHTKETNINNSKRNRGEKNANSKLRDSDIPNIFEMRKSTSVKNLGKKYGVTKSTIERILSRQLFKHLDIPPLRGIRIYPAESRKKLSDLAKKRRNRAIKVVAYKLNGDFVGEYPSASEAGKRLDVDTGCILDVCNGKMKRAKKYKFTFASKA